MPVSSISQSPSESREFYLSYREIKKEIDSSRKEVLKKLYYSDEWIKNPFKHPEWHRFDREMQCHLSDSVKIEKIWNIAITGIDHQLSLNRIGKKHETNPYFFELAHLLGKEGLLSIKPDQPLALWSGGIDLSFYAQSRSFTTLEKTKAGRVFNTLMLYPDWEPLGPLWNHLSAEFAHHAGDEAHVFFRIQDPMSVLERQELGLLKPGKKIIFHPMVNKEIPVDVLDLDELSLRFGEDPRLTQKKCLVKMCQQASKAYQVNLHAINKMKLD